MIKDDEPSLACLIADDDNAICQTIQDCLKEMNIFKFLITAENGFEAKKKIINQQFNLLIVDINMPKINGIQLLAESISQGKVKPERVLIISGDFSPENIKKIGEIGVRNFLVKPFDKEGLVNKINSMLKFLSDR